MNGPNVLTIAGNVTRDPELRTTNGGKSVTTISVAVNRQRKRRGSTPGAFDQVDEVTFVDVVAWEELAEHVTGSVRKGDRVLVTGRLEQRHYTPREGARRTVFELVAQDVGVSLLRHEVAVQRVERRSPAAAGGYNDLGSER